MPTRTEVSRLDFDLASNVVEYRALFDAIGSVDEDAEAVEIAKQIQAIESDKLPALYEEAREYDMALRDALDVIAARLERLKEAKAAFETALSRHREAIKSTMEALGTSKINLNIGGFTVRNNPPAAEIIDESIIPNEYKRITVSIDKMAIRNALKEGETVPGATLAEPTTSLMVR